MKPTRQETVRRYGLLGLGLLITAFGIAFSIQAGLGTSPISSLPYVVSLLTPLSVGTATICLHGVLILLQLLILRRSRRTFLLKMKPSPRRELTFRRMENLPFCEISVSESADKG